jgi:hypothetical protein
MTNSAPPVTVDDVVKTIERGDIEVYTKVTGLSTAQDTYDVFAPFDGRVEDIMTEIFDLVGKEDAMARMVSTEMAALLDSSSEESKSQTEKRWKGVFDYYPIKPEFPGVVTSIYVQPRTRVHKGDRLFTLAKRVVVVGKNLEPLYSTLAPGMSADLIYGKDDSVKLKATLVNFMALKETPRLNRLWLEVDGLRSGIRIGEQFNGYLLVGRSENTMLVPRKMLFEKAGRQYLIMEVETGLVTEQQTEILRPGMHFIAPDYFEIRKKEKPDGKTKKTD